MVWDNPMESANSVDVPLIISNAPTIDPNFWHTPCNRATK